MDFHRHSRTPTRKFPLPPRRIHSYAATALKASRWRVHFSAWMECQQRTAPDRSCRCAFFHKIYSRRVLSFINEAKVTSFSRNYGFNCSSSDDLTDETISRMIKFLYFERFMRLFDDILKILNIRKYSNRMQKLT